MDFASIPLFNVMKAKLGYLSERQGLLAQNVANADVPGYKAMDVAKPDFARLVKSSGGASGSSLRMTTTSAQHMSVSSGGDGSFKTEKRANTSELNPDGNNVVIEDEMSKIAENQAEYQKVINLYSKTIAMFKTAIGNSSSGS